MTAWSRLISVLLVTVLLGGPLASLAGAQQPAQPPAPDLFQETLKAERTRGQQSSAPSSAYDAGAVLTNVFLIPGRAITCGLGAVVGVGVLALTLGTAYKAASSVWHEGCGGRWMVTAEDMRPDGVSGRPLDYTEMR